MRFLPPHHLGPTLSRPLPRKEPTRWRFGASYEHSLDSKDRLTVPSALPRRPRRRCGSRPRASMPASGCHDRGVRELDDHFLAPHSPFGGDARNLRRRFHAAPRRDARLGRPDPHPEEADRARRPRRALRRDRCRRLPRDLERRGLGRAGAGARRGSAPRSPRDWRGRRSERGRARITRHRDQHLTYMPIEHVPVLAPELIDLIAPQPGETAVDCTFGGGGHARLVAERIGPDGTLDRDRPRPGRPGALRSEFAADAPCQTRFIADRLRRGLRSPARRRHPGRRGLHGSRYVLDCRSTPRSAVSPTPTTRRSTCGWTRARS